MATYTIRHHIGMSCSETVGILTDAYRRFTSGRQYQTMLHKFGVVGSLRAIEITYGENGFHPHIHTLLLGKPGMRPQTPDMGWWFLSRWQSMFTQQEYKPDGHGLEISIDGQLGDYVTKVAPGRGEWGIAEEITKQPSKKGRHEGRTPQALLFDYAMGEERAGYIWKEIVDTFSGKKQLVPSSGFWKLLQVEEPTESAEGVDEHPQDAELARIDLPTWRRLCRHEARGLLLEGLEKGKTVSDILFSLPADR